MIVGVDEGRDDTMKIDSVLNVLATSGMPESREADVRFYYEERAAIREFDGGQSRVEAERAAGYEAIDWGLKR